MIMQFRAAGQLFVIFLASAVTVPATAAVSFVAGPTIELAESDPKDMLVTDFNHDLHLDLAVTCYGTDSGAGALNILLGNGNGGFNQDNVAGPVHPWGVACGLFNADVNLDLAVAEGGSGSTIVRILMGNGDGGFSSSPSINAGTFPIAAVSADFNHDGFADLAVANNVRYGLSIFLNTGSNAFSPAVQVPGFTSLHATDLTMGDFNEDGNTDLLLGHYNGAAIALGNGSGSFTSGGGVGSSNLIEAVAVGDVNHDGHADTACVEIYNDRLLLNRGNGNATFQSTQPYAAGSFLTDVTLGDLNNDGRADAVVASQDTNSVKVFLANAANGFDAPLNVPTGPQPAAVAIGDWNEDGFGDVAVAYRNFGDAASVNIFLQVPPAAIPGDVDGDGHVNVSDLLATINQWGACPAPPMSCPADVAPLPNGDGQVNVSDLLLVINNWS